LAIDDRELGERRVLVHEGQPARALARVPVWILVNQNTFSAAEALAFVLRSRERATLTGEVSGGGAHAGILLPLPGGYVVFLPMARASDAATGRSWETTGVVPDTRVAEGDALATAHLEALARLKAAGSEDVRRHLQWAEYFAKARHRPYVWAPSEMENLVGEYGTRRVSLQGEELVYQRGESAARRLVAIDEALLVVEGLRDFLLRVERDVQGRVVALVGLYRDGSTDRTPKSMSGQAPPHR